MQNWLAVVIMLSCLPLVGQRGMRIEVDLKNFHGDTLFLGYYYGNSQYLSDTTLRGEKGTFVFSRDQEREGGVYLILMPPDNRFLQIMLNPGNQNFYVTADADEPVKSVVVNGSPDTEAFYSYLRYLNERRPMADSLSTSIQETADESVKSELQAKLEALNQEVRLFQSSFVQEQAGTLSAAMVRTNLPLDVPSFEGNPQEVQEQTLKFYQKNYLKNVDLSDARLLRTPFLYNMISNYEERLTAQHPDSISKSIDFILSQMPEDSELFKYYLIHFLNKYAKSNLVGMDGVYVHLTMNYYAKGKAPWVAQDQLTKIIDNAKILEPLLIGKTAPNIRMYTRENQPIYLHDVSSPYIVLFFWAPDCGHCEESMPNLISFYEKYKERGVEVFAACTKLLEETAECWKKVDEKGLPSWINVTDTNHQSRFRLIYDLKTTPQIYILDRNKTILSKKIGTEQLADVMDMLMQQDSQQGN